jgi:four helix bundle protein
MSDFAERFEGLRIWQPARVVANQLYDGFPSRRDNGFRDQIQCAAVASMNYIAEGFERPEAKDFGYFLVTAKAFLGQARSMPYLAEDRMYLISKGANAMLGKACRFSTEVAAFRQTL